MLLEALLAISTALSGIDAGALASRTRFASVLPAVAEHDQRPAIPYFSSTARAVSNWRDEAGASLVPASLAFVVKFAETDPAFVARCVKLNNYWCIKQARWAGELGGDAEGHTGFATAADGADAAALLLRRYYREFGRRTAVSIVRRWAPAECGSAPLHTASRLVGRVSATPTPKVSANLAPRGIGNTVRARFLARRSPGIASRRLAITPVASDAALRVQPWSARARLAGHPRRVARLPAAPLPQLKPVADIATGIGGSSTEVASPRRATAAASLAPRPARPVPSPGAVNPAALLMPDRLAAESAALPSIVAGLPGGSLLDLRVPAPLCSTDEVRIRNYANRIAGSVGLKADDDLALFEADGTPTPRFAPVLLVMSAVELGSLRASPALVDAAIARLEKRFTGSAASAE